MKKLVHDDNVAETARRRQRSDARYQRLGGAHQARFFLIDGTLERVGHRYRSRRPEPNPRPRLLRRRLHELADGIEDDLELSVALRSPRAIKVNIEIKSMATPCSVKA